MALGERYLFGDDHRLKKNFVKKFKKIPQWDDFGKDTCLGQSGQNTGFRKEKSKKVRKNQTISKFFRKILGEGKRSRWQASQRKNGKKSEKVRPLPDFRRRYLFGAIRWQL